MLLNACADKHYNTVTYQGSPVTQQLNGASLLYFLVSATMKTNASS
jgi:hypothetical protein